MGAFLCLLKSTFNIKACDKLHSSFNIPLNSIIGYKKINSLFCFFHIMYPQ